jgi:hypothetical protein
MHNGEVGRMFPAGMRSMRAARDLAQSTRNGAIFSEVRYCGRDSRRFRSKS